jgi:hypothetical protein
LQPASAQPPFSLEKFNELLEMLGIETRKEEEVVAEDEAVVEAVAEATPAEQQETELNDHLSEGD